MKEGRYVRLIHHGEMKEIPIREPVYVSRFEYDYLIAQEDVDTQVIHMSRMIDMGYFKELSPYFIKDTLRTGRDIRYVPIGVIRDLLSADAFMIEDKEREHENTIRKPRWDHCNRAPSGKKR